MKSWYQWISFIVLVAVLLAKIGTGRPEFSKAAEVNLQDWEYCLNEEATGMIITKYNGTDQELMIPDTIEGYPVVKIGDSAFEGNINMTGDLTIPDSVKVIGRDAFNGCSRLNGRLTLPENLEEIGESAFRDCNFTGTLHIPSGITVFNSYVFQGCDFSGLLILPEKTTYIGYDAFGDCRYLTGLLKIPDGVDYIGELAFRNCNGIEQLALSTKVSIIRAGTFECCSSLQKALVPKEVNAIEEGAFSHCYSLTIYGYAESEAYSYAKKNSIPFVDVEAPTPTPTIEPTQKPTLAPTQEPTPEPTLAPTQEPTTEPTIEPTQEPTTEPTIEPTQEPTTTPTIEPAKEPTSKSTEEPTKKSTSAPLDSQYNQAGVNIRAGDLMIYHFTKKKGDQAGICWRKNNPATSYEIYRSTKKSKGYRLVKRVSSEKTSWVDKKAKRGKIYYYKMRAVYRWNGSSITGSFTKPVKTKRQYLRTPKYAAKRVKKGSTHYIRVSIKKKEGKYIELYFQRKGKKKKRIHLTSNRLKKTYKLQYNPKEKKMTLWLRTYKKKGKKKRYSQYAKRKV